MSEKSGGFLVFVFFDSETSTVDGVAYPVAYGFIVTDERLRELSRGIVRTAEDMVGVIRETQKKSDERLKVYAYNLFFDFYPLIEFLSYRYTFKFFAKTEFNFISVDCVNRFGDIEIRFCDLKALQPGGLRVCGLVAGLPKLAGSFDFEKVRSSQTPLTVEEEEYIYRDVEIMPAYLEKVSGLYGVPRPWFGEKIITSSQLGRERARRQFDGITLGRYHRTPEVLQKVASAANAAPNEWSLLLRRACNRGGLVFVNAQKAGKVEKDCTAYDFVSAYHFFIQNLRVPVGFKKASKKALKAAIVSTLDTPKISVLSRGTRQFNLFFHAEIEVKNLRLKPWFAERGIGSFSKSKMAAVNIFNEGMAGTVKVQAEDREKRRDRVWNSSFFFEKLLSADKARLHVTEQEVYIMGLLYDWDSLHVIEGEMTRDTTAPPDWQTMRSMFLYEQKRLYKKAFIEGDAQALSMIDIDTSEIDAEAARVLYQNVKTEINTLFGELVRELRAPEWKTVRRDEDIPELRLGVVPEYDGKEYGFFNQGIRVAGGARLQLALLLDYCRRKGVEVLYGDTDSITVRDNDRGDFAELAGLLNTVRREADGAARSRIFKKTGRVFDNDGVGFLEVDKSFAEFCVMRPKTWGGRLSDGRVVLRASGVKLSNMAPLVAERPTEYPLTDVLGWNVSYSKKLVPNIVRTPPELFEMVEVDSVDYLGEKFTQYAPRAVAISEDFARSGNSELHKTDLDFLESIGNAQDTSAKFIGTKGVRRESDNI